MRKVSIGKQDFASLRENDYFFVDKSDFIREWWESGDEITLIARPRRFGKTLNMEMLKCFFSNQYANRQDLFEGLSVWESEKYRCLQGTFPVLFLSFAAVKADNLSDVKKQLNAQIAALYEEHRYLLQGNLLSENEKSLYQKMTMYMEDAQSSISIQLLCQFLYRYYKKKVIVLLDEYDTPMQEAYIHGYWAEFTSFIRSFFNATFKTNSCLERAVMTGITRISKESIFSDLNNLNVVTTTSEDYASCFGFTEEEVFSALEEMNLVDQKENVKRWYDGFVFGRQRDIYNPWSITNYLDKRQFQAYWAATSSNALINRLIRTSSGEQKACMEQLLNNECIVVNFDEQIIFEHLDQDENAIWSLLLAGGYLRADSVEYRGVFLEPWYHLKITNLETQSMFANMFRGWFSSTVSSYNGFVRALIQGDLDAMNHYMNKVALATFSYFDTGKNPSEYSEPEKFYHGFVLGLMVEYQEKYVIRSNRESGFGRYDVLMLPREIQQSELPAIILEFKIQDEKKERTLEDTVQNALRQIEEKQYDTELINSGIKKEQIRHYGFAFCGKQVLIGA